MVTRRNTEEIKRYLKPPMENLPNDIVVVVLFKLPVKSLIRFKCVCKAWRSLICKPQFIKTHLNQAIENTNAGCHRLLVPTSPLLRSIDCEAQNNGDINVSASSVLDFLPASNYASKISGSCNGLVCLLDHRDQIILFNPSTRDSRTLPKPITTNTRRTAWGLGYDSSIDDYKVVTVFGPFFYSGILVDCKVQVEVFSLRRKSWKIAQDIHNRNRTIVFNGSGAFLNGALYWLGNRGTEQLIVSFDIATENFQELLLPLPPGLGDGSFSICSLNVLDGCISVIRRHIYHEHEVWIMKEYGVGASWTKLFSIFEECRPHRSCYLAPVCFSKNGEFLVEIDDGQLQMYNPKAKMFRDIDIQDIWKWSRTVPYVESLVAI